MRIKPILKVAGAVAVACLIIAVLSAAAFERVSRDRALRDFPPPGRMIDIGGRRIQLDCRGTGSPVVVFESGLDISGSLAWATVPDTIGKTTRACTYSRAGIMWSDPSGHGFDVDSAAADLRTALNIAGEPAPYVIVAHSLGGPIATVFASRYPDDVAGLVMVDVTHPDQFQRYDSIAGHSIAPSATEPRIGAALSWTGLLRMLPAEGTGAAPAFLPLTIHGIAAEVTAIPATLARAGGARSLGDMPLVVLSAGLGASPEDLQLMKMTAEQGAAITRAHHGFMRDMATWSTRGRFELVPDASHYIQRDRPDDVVGAVHEIMGYVMAHDTPPRRR